MSLAVGASPLTTGTAYADGETATLSVALGVYTPGDVPVRLDLAQDSADYGTEMVARKGTAALAADWSLLPNRDGSFLIRNDKHQKCIDFNTDNNHLALARSCDASNRKQNWYLDSGIDNSYRIRNVNNNKCMDLLGGKEGDTVGLYDCGSGKVNQRWYVLGPTVAGLATEYALKQCSNSSGIIKSCDYEVTGDEKPTVAPSKIVAPRVFNYSTSVAKRTLTWSDTSTRTHTVGGSITLTSEVGVNIEVVNVKVSTAISAHYSHAWQESSTVSDSKMIDVNPGQSSWAVRGQLMKTIKGKWTFTNDLGEKWSGDGTATVPVVDGTEGAKEVMAYCTSDSTEPTCVATR
ncbi:RICIN domain-containing protein [Streptomyces inhibens]|uniref:RICIN domain-containing protein n=1 Tax=Streptomyces inhibens TaxID=2293571 RepID=UPI00369B7AAD